MAAAATFSKNGSTFLVKRFDRDGNRRLHFASAMTLLGKRDGALGDDNSISLELAMSVAKYFGKVSLLCFIALDFQENFDASPNWSPGRNALIYFIFVAEKEKPRIAKCEKCGTIKNITARWLKWN